MDRGSYFKAKRHALHMTQAHLGMAAGVDERTIRSLEKNENVSAETLRAVASVLSIDLTERRRPEPTEAVPRRYRANVIAGHLVRIHVITLQILAACAVIATFLNPIFVWITLSSFGTLAIAIVVKATGEEERSPPAADRISSLFITFGTGLSTVMGPLAFLTQIDKSHPLLLDANPVATALVAFPLFASFATAAVSGVFVVLFARNKDGRTFLGSLSRRLHPFRLWPTVRKYARILNRKTDLG